MPHPLVRFPSTAKFSLAASSVPPRFRVQVDAPPQASNRCLRQCGLPQGAGLFCIWLSRKARRPRLQPGTGRAVSPQCLLWPRLHVRKHATFLAQQRGRSPGAFDFSESHEQHTTPPDTRCCSIRCRDDCCCEPSSGRSFDCGTVAPQVVEGAAPQHPAAAIGLSLPAG
jgi:hypothetical protein